MTLEFLVTAFIVVATPGTGAIYTIAMGLMRGRSMSIVAAFGCTLGIVPHMAAAILGLAAVLSSSEKAFMILKLAGIIYLIYMAIDMLRAGGGGGLGKPDTRQSGTGIVMQAILINLLNPKLSLFFLAFLPQFVDPSAEGAVSLMIADSLVFMLMTFVVFAIYGLFAASLRDRVVERPNVLAWIRRVFATAFLAMAAKLALA
ncbi:LysE family translocator [Ciceribacter sp. L1K22]|uniref:LysE family translocator n=1 Tax=Ciceribacter sp. L1K22 TaxID=2820275 RepID=UPI001ABDE7C8|nr:LysE family translocator [Ciceribacter sp. L1K22]MBO3761018.1 LysE family translocator [Ciceribacter sp. L1K22]